MTSQHSRDQYSDGVHDAGPSEVYKVEAQLAEAGANDIYFAFPEFASDGSWQPAYPVNPDPPPLIGTTNIQDFCRLLSRGFTDSHGHSRSGRPTAVIVSTDNGATWSFVTDLLNQ